MITEPPVRLRPIRADELDLLISQPRSGSPPGYDQAREQLRERIERGGRLVDGRIDLGIEAHGSLVGQVEARQPKAAMPAGVFEIGISLFEAERGKGYGRAAVELLTEHLIRVQEGHRIQASTDLENRAMRTVLERAGYVFEGVLRGFMPTREGGRADYAIYGITRADWERRAT
ncbi:MAG: GNAT family N-acetyltransferase [Gaiellaceae bacterium]